MGRIVASRHASLCPWPSRRSPASTATGANIAHLPAGQAAGYVTGSGGVPWTAEDWAAHPGAVRIDQSPASTVPDYAADVQDFEAGAVTLAELAPRVKVMLAAWHAGVRPGQRSPAVYASASSITEVVNALVAGGVTTCGLAVADYSVTKDQAEATVAEASGPFPVIWFQWADAGLYDEGVFSVPWLNTVSVAKPPAPPGQWADPSAWTWNEAVVAGTGLDGNFHLFALDGRLLGEGPLTGLRRRRVQVAVSAAELEQWRRSHRQLERTAAMLKAYQRDGLAVIAIEDALNLLGQDPDTPPEPRETPAHDPLVDPYTGARWAGAPGSAPDTPP